jgi:hypothetical protein
MLKRIYNRVRKPHNLKFIGRYSVTTSLILSFGYLIYRVLPVYVSPELERYIIVFPEAALIYACVAISAFRKVKKTHFSISPSTWATFMLHLFLSKFG